MFLSSMTLTLKKLIPGAVLAVMACFTASAAAQNNESALRAGDSVVIKISGVPAEEIVVVNNSYDISDNGTINLPYIGQVKASGMRPSTLQQNIQSAYKSAEIYTNPTIQVAPNRDANTQVVFVSGEVKTPGKIPMSPGMTVHGAIVAAGDMTEFAKAKTVRLLRNGKAVEIDLRRVDNPAAQTPVQPGDTIHVPQ
jgi:protein involved in polysaccharide export with SLBB domain